MTLALWTATRNGVGIRKGLNRVTFHKKFSNVAGTSTGKGGRRTNQLATQKERGPRQPVSETDRGTKPKRNARREEKKRKTRNPAKKKNIKSAVSESDKGEKGKKKNNHESLRRKKKKKWKKGHMNDLEKKRKSNSAWKVEDHHNDQECNVSRS